MYKTEKSRVAGFFHIKEVVKIKHTGISKRGIEPPLFTIQNNTQYT